MELRLDTIRLEDTVKVEKAASEGRVMLPEKLDAVKVDTVMLVASIEETNS